MATVKKIKKAQIGDSLTMKISDVYKANKATLDSAQKRNSLILRNPSNLASQDSSNAAKVMNRAAERVSGSSAENMTKEAAKEAAKKTRAILAKKSLKKGGSVAKDGKWIQKATASIKKRGTEGKCTPITKPGCTGRAKALAKTFKKMAKKK